MFKYKIICLVAYNKDIGLVGRSVEELTVENMELKKKLEHEKVRRKNMKFHAFFIDFGSKKPKKITKEKLQFDLSLVKKDLNEAAENIR